MWHCPDKYDIKLKDLNAEFKKLKGGLDDKEAKITLAKFLRNNLGLTTELISGIKLAPYQEVTLKALMNRNFSMCVWGRGCGKTFIASVFCFLQCIFEPRTKILIAGPTFRTARFIFNNLETMVESEGAELLAQAFGAKIKRNDQYEWKINGGTITAIPLNGEKIRGFRANVLVLDEYMLIPEDIINNVLMPFLVAPQDIKERLQIREVEDKLIKEGSMKEEDRRKFENTSKMIALSSASYTFENLYKTYKEWTEKITSKDEVVNAKYFISQMGYEALPAEMIDPVIIEEAQSGGQSHSSFLREYCAQFTDGSDSYFSAKKMHLCTIPDGEEPTTQLFGTKGSKYVLGIDPSFSNSPSSDFFAMSVLELDDKTEQGTLVHSYAVAGGNLSDHIKYLHYVLTHFDIEMVIIDNAGAEFIDSANASAIFKESKIRIDFFEFNSSKDGEDYKKEISRAGRAYNKGANIICFKQVFTSDFIRKANEHLQTCIDHKKVWFASKTAANDPAFNRYSAKTLPLKHVNEPSVLEFIETQDSLVYQTKKQCALVEVKSTAKGTQTFDLPLHLKKSTSAHKARKDNYTTLMLGCWGIKCYYDIQDAKHNPTGATFSPFMIQ
jgi:hypothetical protein